MLNKTMYQYSIFNFSIKSFRFSWGQVYVAEINIDKRHTTDLRCTKDNVDQYFAQGYGIAHIKVIC